MAKLRTSIVDAAAAADITIVGGSDEVPSAWSGGASAEDKKRLAGSLATMRDGKHGYFPVTPGAVLFKTFGTGDSTVLKAELLAYLHCSQSRPARHARLPSEYHCSRVLHS